MNLKFKFKYETIEKFHGLGLICLKDAPQPMYFVDTCTG